MAVWSVAVMLGLTCVWVPQAWTSPLKTYDQRQHGDLNIHAQLDNIVVLVIPSARLNLLELAMGNKISGEKGGFLQLLQKLHKVDIDRYETIKEEDELQAESSPGEFEIDIRKPIPVTTTSQQVSLNYEGEIGDKEEEVVATVEEMKPDPTVKPVEVPNPQLTEDSAIKEQSFNDEVIKDSVLKEAVPVQEKHIKKDEENTAKEESQTENDTAKQPKPLLGQDLKIKSCIEFENVPKEKFESSEKESSKTSKSEIEEPTKETIPKTPSVELQEERKTIEDYIKPVAAKEEITPASSVSKKTQHSEEHPPKKSVEPVRLQEGVRKEKVIRYKPEAKWAPELVDLLGPPRSKPKDHQERHMFANLCSPGAWDPELRTCIMPGETRSRGELARFLNAMRFGISIPK